MPGGGRGENGSVFPGYSHTQWDMLALFHPHSGTGSTKCPCHKTLSASVIFSLDYLIAVCACVCACVLASMHSAEPVTNHLFKIYSNFSIFFTFSNMTIGNDN